MRKRQTQPGGRTRPSFNEKQVERMRYMAREERVPLKDIARIMGSSPTTVGEYIRGHRKPTPGVGDGPLPLRRGEA